MKGYSEKLWDFPVVRHVRFTFRRLVNFFEGRLVNFFEEFWP